MECELFDVWYKWNCDCNVWIEVELENEHFAWKPFWKLDNTAMEVPIWVMKSSETSPNENQNLCCFLVWGWASKFKAEPWKCERISVECQPSGAPTLGPLQVWNEILMLRLSVGIWGWALAARFHVFAILMCFIALTDLKWIILTVLVCFEWDWVNMDLLYVIYVGISWINSKCGWSRVCKDIRT